MFERIKERRRAEGEEGFTLIELLVVIIILGILAAVVVFAVGGVGDKGQAAACQIDKRTLRTAEEAYAAQPTSKGGGGGDYVSQGITDSTTPQDLVPNFLSEPPQYHTVSATPSTNGPDGIKGTTDDVASTFTITAVAGKGC